MTREKIENIRLIVIPFVVNKLEEIDYEGQGDSDAEKFWNDFNEIFDLAIKALEQEPIYYPPCIDCNKKMDEIRNAYDNMTTKALEQEPRWIPVSERLPEEYKRVLVSDSWCGVYVGQYVDAEENWGGEHFINEAGMHSKTVVAWMPLPQPYKTESEEK